MFGANRIVDVPEDAIMNINYVVLKEGVSLDEVAEKVAYLCEHVKTYHSDTGFYGGFVALNTGVFPLRVPLPDKSLNIL